MIVGGKQGERALVGKPGHHRAGDRGAVVCGSASAKLINENKGVARSMGKDRCSLLQLHKEG